MNLVLAPGTSIAANPGTQITGLPATANDYSALVQVTDLVTGAVLSGGYVVNNEIVLSGWAATPHGIAISAQYFAV